VLETIRSLLERLNLAEVTYVHWKSNMCIDDALNGEGDLDLLVDRADADKFHDALAGLHFRLVLPSNGDSDPGVHHYYGLDATTGTIIHLHIYFSITTGGDVLKNYRLPLERMLFENRRWHGTIPLPHKSIELFIFITRAFLKYGSLIEHALLTRDGSAARKEFQWLLDGGSEDQMLNLVDAYLSAVNPRLITACMDALQTNAGGLKKLMLGRKFRSSLQQYRRHPALVSSAINSIRFSRKVTRKLLGLKATRPFPGGLVLAIVGPEASGKSTLVREIAAWLGRYFPVVTVHAGKPSSSPLTLLPNIALPLLRRIFWRYKTSLLENDEATPPETRQERKASLPFIIRSLMIAHDRKRVLTRAYRAASKGNVVICDRYPSPAPGAVDSAQLDQALSHNGKGFLARMALKEKKIYKSIPGPDLVIQLTVPVDIAVARNVTRKKKGIETEDYVRRRHKQSIKTSFPGVRSLEVNTDKDLAETLLSVKHFIWQSI
jgi:thymidylate kinase